MCSLPSAPRGSAPRSQLLSLCILATCVGSGNTLLHSSSASASSLETEFEAPFGGLVDLQGFEFSCTAAARRRLALDLASGNATSEDVVFYAKTYNEHLASKIGIYLLHVSKTGGSQICSCGWDSGCRSPGERSLVDNCHGASGADPWGKFQQQWFHAVKYDLTCPELEGIFQNNTLTLIADEGFMFNPDPCPHLLNVVVLRDPVDRLISHINEMKWHFKPFVGVADGFGGDFHLANMTAVNVTPDWVFANMPLLSNNYYTRSLLGHSVYSLPFGSINDEHLVKAKQTLLKFDLVFTLDNLVHQIKSTLGMWCHEEFVHRGAFPKNLSMVNWSAQENATIQLHNAVDIRLVEFAKTLVALDQTIFSSVDFSKYSDCSGDIFGSCGWLCQR